MNAKPSPGPTSPPGTFFRTLGAYDWAGVYNRLGWFWRGFGGI